MQGGGHCRASPPWRLRVGAAPRSYQWEVPSWATPWLYERKRKLNAHADMTTTVSPPWYGHYTARRWQHRRTGPVGGSATCSWHHTIAEHQLSLVTMVTPPQKPLGEGCPGSSTRQLSTWSHPHGLKTYFCIKENETNM